MASSCTDPFRLRRKEPEPLGCQYACSIHKRIAISPRPQKMKSALPPPKKNPKYPPPPKSRNFMGMDQRTPWGGGKRRGTENLTNDTPPKKGVWTPSCGTFSTPLGCRCSTARSSFGGVQIFLGRARSLVRFPPLISWHEWRFSPAERKNPGAHGIGAVISGPRIAGKQFYEHEAVSDKSIVIPQPQTGARIPISWKREFRGPNFPIRDGSVLFSTRNARKKGALFGLK